MLFGVTLERWLLLTLLIDLLLRHVCTHARRRTVEGFSGHPSAHFLLTDGDGNLTTLPSTVLAGALDKAEAEAASAEQYVVTAAKREVKEAMAEVEARVAASTAAFEARMDVELKRVKTDIDAETRKLLDEGSQQVTDARAEIALQDQKLAEALDAQQSLFVKKDVYYVMYNKAFDRLLYKTSEDFVQTKAGNQYTGSNSEQFMITDAP